MSPLTANARTTSIRIPIGQEIFLDADLSIPRETGGLVLFAHGSGSGRHSTRNRAVAARLNTLHMATLLADLLTADEERVDIRTAALRFDIPMLTRRVVQLIDWARSEPRLEKLPCGLFGASTGAAAALDAAAARPEATAAVVSRGGRPDLASHIEFVRAPTLLIVGGDDTEVLEMNREALRRMTAPSHLEVVPGATHLFEEPGALETVASVAGEWFERYLFAPAGGAA